MQAQKSFVTKDQVNKMCLELYDKMVFEDYRPDTIVCIMNGGYVPSMKLASLFGCSVKPVSVSKYDISGKPFAKTEYRVADFQHLVGKKVLIVDDVVETGESISIIKNALRVHTQAIKTACLFESESVKRESESDYKVVIKRNDVWVLFPWECSV